MSHAPHALARPPASTCPECGGDVSGLPFCPRDGALLTPFALGARYVVDQACGMGRNTIALAGHHAVLGRRVVVKVLRPELAANAEARARFLERADRVTELQHESILGLRDYGEDAHLGLPYVVTDYLAGPSLAELMRGQPQLPIPFIVATLVKVARGLAASHEAGLVHGDLSARNVVVERNGDALERVLVCDLGMSVLPEGDRNAWLAAPVHLAPEQIRQGRPFDARADIYALGVLGYEMITGSLPFAGRSSQQVIEAKLSGAPVRMPRDERSTDVPNPLRRVLERCLSFDPAQRPDSMLDVATDLVGSRNNACYSQPPPPVGESLIGQRIGPYMVEELLGAGGVGEVFRARHERIGSEVAIKVLREEVARNKKVVERFEQEARAASAVGDPCIPAFYDFGYLEDGRPYAIMEYLRGETVAEFLERNGRLDFEETKVLIAQVARAMSRAHAIGIIHRDLKPENLFLMEAERLTPSRSTVRILDFGIAKILSPELAQSTNHTHVGTFMGTPDYCAPEQVYGGDVGARTDVYALGAIAFAALTGRPPFVAANAGEVLLAKATDPAPRLSALREDVPLRVEETVSKMLERDPSGRPPSMKAVLQMLDRWDETEMPAVLARPWERSEKQRSAPWLPLAALVAMVLATAGIALAVMFSDGGAELAIAMSGNDAPSVTAAPMENPAPAPGTVADVDAPAEPEIVAAAAVEAPGAVEAPAAVEAPEVETPQVDVETPEVETPEVETPEAETPEVETPEAETPEVEATEPVLSEREARRARAAERARQRRRERRRAAREAARREALTPVVRPLGPAPEAS